MIQLERVRFKFDTLVKDDLVNELRKSMLLLPAVMTRQRNVSKAESNDITSVLIYIKQETKIYKPSIPNKRIQTRFLTYMDDMPIAIDHDVAVMPILDLQDVASHRISRHRLDEVETSLLEGDSVLSAIFCHKKVQQVIHFGTPHLIPGCRVWYHIDHTALHVDVFEPDI